ncbi:type VI secretion protein IcmF/TssM N-terminal domain-containing protein [Aquisphaera insulae]|uniref:type VI secretion protein IcmF/TssM N-terminal domain-containing protein n=1 Tax=Aquisphaera insulae TaxID=2712864 RepID=UPI0013E9F099|nr:type VI secretion protein IcmF/TssM N-terminal domain-containing protein [Aquisphaera insulae]
MLKLINKPWEWICYLWGLVFPMFSSQEAAEKAAPAARWIGRACLVGIVLGILWVINQLPAVGLPNLIPNYPKLARIWLPLFALCLYVLLWLGWWLYRILSMEVETEASEFPDIDRAWAQAMEALARAEVRLDATPLYLVLGWTSGTEESFFQAGGIKARVKQVPADKLEPIHVTADRESIWVSCPGASLLGQHDPSFVGQADGGGAVLSTMMEDQPDPFKTMGAGLGPGGLEDLLANARKEIDATRAAGRPSQSIDRQKYLARLRHLCRLIRRDRLGFCPINGVLVVLPISAADPRSRPEEIAAACRQDLEEGFETLRIRCPILVLISDLERVPGFSDLTSRLPSAQLNSRMGQRFPLVPDLREDEVPAKVESSVEWVTSSLFGSMVYSLFRVESNRSIDEIAEVLRGNQALFQFLGKVRERKERLARLVRDSIPTLRGEKLMFGGCYFAATGDGDGERAFASGVLNRLVQDQDLVSWTEQAMAIDAGYARTAVAVKRVLMAFAALLALGIVGLLVMKFSGRA